MKQKIEKVIEEFNRMFKSECKLLDISKEEIKVLFKGHICFTCGAYDYFEDMASKISEKLNKEYRVARYEQQENGEYIVYFKPEDKTKEIQRDIKVFLYI